MTGGIINHLWQSTVFLLAAALAAFALRRNQASVRHAVWLAASLKFLVPFSLLIALGGAVPWPAAETPDAPITPAVAAVVETVRRSRSRLLKSGDRAGRCCSEPNGDSWPTVLGSVDLRLSSRHRDTRSWMAESANGLRASTPTRFRG
jgi:hypothetical protein